MERERNPALISDIVRDSGEGCLDLLCDIAGDYRYISPSRRRRYNLTRFITNNRLSKFLIRHLRPIVKRACHAVNKVYINQLVGETVKNLRATSGQSHNSSEPQRR